MADIELTGLVFSQLVFGLALDQPPFTCYILLSPFRKNMWSAHIDTEGENMYFTGAQSNSLLSISDEISEF